MKLTGTTKGTLDVQRLFEILGKIWGEQNNAVVTVKSVQLKDEEQKNQSFTK